MDLRTALENRTIDHGDSWVRVPGSRPATTMLVSHFDLGAAEPRTRAIPPHSLAVYQPDARLSIVWQIDEDDDRLGSSREEYQPEWVEDAGVRVRTKAGWSVILLGGSPIWQEHPYYVDWGSGVGGYVPHLQPVFEDEPDSTEITGWTTTHWEVGHADLLSSLSNSAREWWSVHPVRRLVPNPLPGHPVDHAIGDR